LDITQVKIFGFPRFWRDINFVHIKVGFFETFDWVFVREAEVAGVFDEVEKVSTRGDKEGVVILDVNTIWFKF